MRLPEFISRNMEPILQDYEAFAATRQPAADRMTSFELRDHARQMLNAIIADLETPQTREAQSAKSMGLAGVRFEAPETAAQTHAILRARSGFDIVQFVSEFRALRASVLRLWIDACLPAEPDMDDMVRFNEAVDQALAEGVVVFSEQVELSRNLLLGMFSHDLRSPLQTIQMTAQYLQALNAQREVSEAASRLIKSGAHMQALLSDLLDFNRSKLGLSIRVTPTPTDLASVCAEEIDEIRAGHPARSVEFEVAGNCHGLWDGGRIRQLLGNLVTNAINYSAPDTPVRVALVGDEVEVRLAVMNVGHIDQGSLAQIFEPLKRGTGHGYQTESGMGLGLYIVSEVAKAHGGWVEATSDTSSAIFTVHLPRRHAPTKLELTRLADTEQTKVRR